jgi:hypothetical protein
MCGMRLPPSVHVVLGPSRIVGVGVGLAAVGLLAVVFAMPFPAWQQGAVMLAVLAWAARTFAVVALRRGPRAITELRLAPDLVLVVHHGDGRLVAGHVRSASYVGALVTSIVWRPDDAWHSRAILIVPDMLPADDFRRLRVMLRYARNAVAQDAPASHA